MAFTEQSSDMNKNAHFRIGCFFYSHELDEQFLTYPEEEAYKKKNEYIIATSVELVAVTRRSPISEVGLIASHTYNWEDRFSDDGRQREPHIHVLFYQRDYTKGTSRLLQHFFRTRKFPGDWITTKCPEPHRFRTYLYSGRGRRVHQENMELFNSLGPVYSEHDTTRQQPRCPGRPDSIGQFHSIGSSEINGPGLSQQNSSGSKPHTSKVSIGRRLANLFIQSGAAEQTSFRQWFAQQEELREEYEELVYSKRWKELVDDVVIIAAGDFLKSSWKEILTLNMEQISWDPDIYYDVPTSKLWLEKILNWNSISMDNFTMDITNIIDKKFPKINSLWLQGPSNAGKSLLLNSITLSTRFTVCIQDFTEDNNFPFNDAPGKRTLFINEPSIGPKRVELLKNAMEGQNNLAINVKNLKGITLPRTPIFMASNKDLWEFCRSEKNTLLNRLIYYPLKEFPELIHCEKQLNPNMWFDIVNNIKPETTKMALICYHKNWKILSSPDSRMAELLEKVEPTSDIHVSYQHNCMNCNIALSVARYYDGYNLTGCILCGENTLNDELLCQLCINTFN